LRPPIGFTAARRNRASPGAEDLGLGVEDLDRAALGKGLAQAPLGVGGVLGVDRDLEALHGRLLRRRPGRLRAVVDVAVDDHPDARLAQDGVDIAQVRSGDRSSEVGHGATVAGLAGAGTRPPRFVTFKSLGSSEVKTIGDAVMIRIGSAAKGVRLGLRVVQEVGAQHGFPSIRVGMHTGPATERSSDWFGATVNTAARVSGVATGGEVLVTRATREAADQVEGIDFQERGRHELKNVSAPVSLYAAVTQGERTPEALPIDPVCRMAIAPARAAGRLSSAGVEYHFCSLRCASSFAAAPERYADDGRHSRDTRHRAATALAQGGSYLGFGLWSLAARQHYRRTHEIRRDDWVLNAHGAWLLAVGSTLAAAGLRGQAQRPEIRLLGAGSALGLALNDAALLTRLPRVYQADLLYELSLVGAWLLPGRRAVRARRSE